jgi:hypothetical protein
MAGAVDAIEYIEKVCRLEKERLAGTGLDGHLIGILSVLPALIGEVEWLQAEVATAYAKGAGEMKLRVRVVMCESDTPFRSYDEVWQIAQERILELPLVEPAESVRP